MNEEQKRVLKHVMAALLGNMLPDSRKKKLWKEAMKAEPQDSERAYFTIILGAGGKYADNFIESLQSKPDDSNKTSGGVVPPLPPFLVTDSPDFIPPVDNRVR